MREQIASVQHDIWSHWMKYLFSVCDDSFDGIIIPPDKVRLWKKEIATPYSELTEKQKESDRDQADKVIALFFNGEGDYIKFR